MDKKEVFEKRMLKKHEIIILIAVLLLGILLGNFVFAGPSGRKQCNDGIDNDGDTRIDYPNDPGCSSKMDNNERGTLQCDDGIDNDGDTKTDYPNDAGCSSPSDTSELGAVQCDDGIDNGDADSLKDYPSDLGCVSSADTNEVDGQCDDLSDNDNDTRTDYPNDSGCTGFSDATERGTAQCDDGIDNDADTKIDYPADTGCTDPSDNSEVNVVQCNDGIDNDNDGFVDYPNDLGCNSFTDTDEHSSSLVCDNGIEEANDADTLKDFQISGGDPGCSSVGDIEIDGPCDNLADDDNDGFIDYINDPECTSFASKEGNCADTDGGIVFDAQGTVSGSTGGAPYSNTDFCVDSLNLKEFSCNFWGQPASSDHNCVSNTTTQCLNGACV